MTTRIFVLFVLVLVTLSIAPGQTSSAEIARDSVTVANDNLAEYTAEAARLAAGVSTLEGVKIPALEARLKRARATLAAAQTLKVTFHEKEAGRALPDYVGVLRNRITNLTAKAERAVERIERELGRYQDLVAKKRKFLRKFLSLATLEVAEALLAKRLACLEADSTREACAGVFEEGSEQAGRRSDK